MAKSTKKRTALQMKEVAEIITDTLSKHYAEIEEAFDDVEEPFLNAFKVGARPMVAELRDFVSKGKHYKSGNTLDSFEPGMMFKDDKNGLFYFKFGFDLSRGGFPALILEYGDTGSPMRMPNEPHFFMHWTSKKHSDAVQKGVDEELKKMLKDIGV